jgi:hypothetical protein
MTKGVLAVQAVLAMLLMLCGCSRDDGADRVRLVASIASTNRQLIVQNGDPVVWGDVTITIDGSYVYHADWITRGAESIPYSRFVDSSGEAYSPGLLKLRSVSIFVPDFANGKTGVFEW